MEAAGFAAGILTLAGLFNNAVDCFEYVQIGKAFEQDLDTCLLRLAIARLRLSRWGHAAGLERVVDQQSTSHVQCSVEEVQVAEGLMRQIIKLFEATAETSDGLLKRPQSTQLALVAPATVEQSPVSRITSIMRDISIRRTSKTGLTAKTKWALYKKGQLSSLVDSISDLVNELVDLFPATKETQPVLCLEEATEFCNDTPSIPQVPELQRAADAADPDLAAAIEGALQKRGLDQQTTNYNNVNMSGTFYGQTQNIGVLYGGSSFNSKAQDITIGGENFWPDSMVSDASRPAQASSVTITGQFKDSNVIGYVNNLLFAPNPLSKSAWTVPRAVNTLFIGRADIARILKTAFEDIIQTAGQKPKTFVIVGLGGVGKSEVSIKYAFDNMNNYWGVFWIDCQNEATATESFELIGQECHISRPTIKSVKAWLCSTDRRWLLIIDNADDPKKDYNQYLPAAGRGNIIITTRLQECERYQNVGFIHLEMLERSAARELLFNAAGITIEQRASQQDNADEILSQLAYHTLAIIHAGSYIRKSCSMSEYLEIFSKKRRSILNTPLGQEESTYRTVYATFEASAERLEALSQSTKVEAISQVQASDALDLLHTMAFMHNAGRYELIFSRAKTSARGLQTVSTDARKDSIENLNTRHSSLLPSFCSSQEENVESQIRWRQAYRTLQAFSFVTVVGQGSHLGFSMHQLVHVWARERQSIDKQRVYWQAAASAICLSCPTQHVQPLWVLPVHSFTPTVQEHAWMCTTQFTDDLLGSQPTIPVLQLLFHLAWLTFESGQTHALEKVWSFLKRLEAFVIKCTKENEIPYRELQGHLYWKKDKNKEAIIEFEASLELARQYGWIEERTLLLQRNLARIYQLNHKHSEAVMMLEHIRDVQSTFDRDDPDRIGPVRLLAEMYSDAGHAARAMSMLECIVHGESKFEQDHPEFVLSRLDLAQAYRFKDPSKNIVKTLEPIFELEGWGEVKSLAEPLLRRAYLANGQVDKVITVLEQDIEIEKQIAQDDPHGYIPWGSLKVAYETDQVSEVIYAYFSDNPNEQTQEFLEHIIERSHDKFSRRIYEERHPTVYKYELLLARIYLNLYHYTKAIGLLERLAVVEVLSNDWQYQYCVEVRWLLAKAYMATGRRREASLCFEHILKIQNAHWAGQMHKKFPVLVDIADDLREEGSFDEAIAQYQTMAKLLADSTLERCIPLRLDVRCKLGMAYLHAGRANEALDSLWEDFSYEIACLPADHPTQVATQYAYIQALNAVHGMNIVPEFMPEVNYGW